MDEYIDRPDPQHGTYREQTIYEVKDNRNSDFIDTMRSIKDWYARRVPAIAIYHCGKPIKLLNGISINSIEFEGCSPFDEEFLKGDWNTPPPKPFPGVRTRS